MFGPSEDGQWLVNPTQSEVWAEVQTRRAVRAEAGRAGAEARWRANGKRIAEACDCHDFANGNQSQRQSQRQTESPPPPPPASGDGKPEGKQKPRRQRSPGPGFKGWSEDRFREDVREANTDGVLSDIETEEFIAFWLEPDCRGRPKYQLQKTWSTRRRMQTALARIYEPRRRELTERLAGTGGSRLP